MRSFVAVLALALVVPAAPAAAQTARSDGGTATAAERSEVSEQPRSPRPGKGFVVRRKATGLDHPWDVKPIGKGRLLITERDSARLYVAKNGRKRVVKFPSRSVWVSGETGLMGLETDPSFKRTGRFYTCQGGGSGGNNDVRVVAWKLNKPDTKATRVKVLLKGLPATSGRHGGCRVLVAKNGALVVGTGDAAQGTNPRNLESLGGKTLRLNRFSGKPWPTNPFRDVADKRRYVFTFGHRNVQGLAQRGDGSLWSVEHGSFRDDEVNRLQRGGDYGWHPVPGYNEQVPMTDQGLPGRQVGARWSSGPETIATSGASFVRGKKWGRLNGALAVGVLQGERVLFLTFDQRGRLQRSSAPKALRQYGRIRSVTNVGKNLVVTTDRVEGGDSVLLIKPRR